MTEIRLNLYVLKMSLVSVIMANSKNNKQREFCREMIIQAEQPELNKYDNEKIVSADTLKLTSTGWTAFDLAKALKKKKVMEVFQGGSI